MNFGKKSNARFGPWFPLGFESEIIDTRVVKLKLYCYLVEKILSQMLDTILAYFAKRLGFHCAAALLFYLLILLQL